MTLGLRAGWGFLEMQQGRSPSVRGSGRPAPPPTPTDGSCPPTPSPARTLLSVTGSFPSAPSWAWSLSHDLSALSGPTGRFTK